MNADYVIQSVIFKQPKYTPAEAKKWLKEHNYSGRSLDRTANMLRFRQITPKKVEQYGFTEYRTKELGRSGISLVIAYKKSIDGGSLSNTFRNIWNRIRGRNQAVVVPVAEVAPPPAPIVSSFFPNVADEELVPMADTDAEPVRPIARASLAPDDIEEYYTPIVKKERADLEKLYKKANDAYNVARSDLITARIVFGDVSWRAIEAENRVDRTYAEREEIRRRQQEHRIRETYLPIRNRPQVNTARWDFYRDANFSRDYMERELERERESRIPFRSRPIRQAEIAPPPPALLEKEPPYDLSTFGDREAERLAEAERVYNETMAEEIEKQGMSGEDRPRGSGIYMKGFGRMTGGLVPKYPYAPPPIPSQQLIDDYPDIFSDEVAIQEYNDYIDFLEEEQKAMENYLWQDLNRLDAGIIQVPNREATTNTLFQKIDNIDRIRSELDDILDENQTMEVAQLVKAYMDEYIEIDKPFVDIADWRGGVLLE